jgi:hypothetical protein
LAAAKKAVPFIRAYRKRAAIDISSTIGMDECCQVVNEGADDRLTAPIGDISITIKASEFDDEAIASLIFD